MQEVWYNPVGSGASARPDSHMDDCNRPGEPLSTESDQAEYHCKCTRTFHNCYLLRHSPGQPALSVKVDQKYGTPATGLHRDSQDKRPEALHFLPGKIRWYILPHHKLSSTQINVGVSVQR